MPERARAWRERRLSVSSGAREIEVGTDMGGWQYHGVGEWLNGNAAQTIVNDDGDGTTALGLSIGKLGNVRTETLRAFTGAEQKSILGKVT